MSDEKKTDKPTWSNGAAPRAQDSAPEMRPDDADDLQQDGEFDTEEFADVGADPAAVLQLRVETLETQIADLTGRLLRAHADLDNLRKRAEREKQETARYAISNFAKDTVGLVDNFQRAMQAVDPAVVENDPHLKALLDGVSMTEREFINVLERHGVRRLDPKGETFDPRLHQAVMERQDPSVANGTVVEVFQAGYVIGDRCLRPAIVVVARGGARVQPAPSEPVDETAIQQQRDDSTTLETDEPRPQAPQHGSDSTG